MLTLKGNQGTPHENLVQFLDDPPSPAAISVPAVEGDHGRIEIRTAKVAEQLAMVNEELSRLQASAPAGITLGQLVSMFTVFAGWETCGKDDKRRLLSLYVPRMRLSDGQVVSVYRLLDGTGSRVDRKCSSKVLTHSKITETRVDNECSKNSSSSAPRR